MKKKKPKKASAKAVMQSLFGPIKGISTERVVPLKRFARYLERKRREISPSLRSEEEEDFLHREVARPDVSRAWMRRRLG